jgi:DNA-binding transcriptional LysR family regulator
MHGLVWDDLKYFLAFCDQGSVSAVARSMNVEHSTVVRKLARLEASFTFRLFHRLARGWTLTDEGKELCLRAQAVESSIFKVQHFAEAASDMTGEVKISAPPSLLSDLIGPALKGFKDVWPSISLTLISEMREANLSRSEADIALRMSKLTQAELVTKTVCQITYELYGTKNWSDVAHDDRMYVGFLRNQKSFLSTLMEEHIADRKVAFRTNDLRVVLSAIRTGSAIGLLPRFMGQWEADMEIVEKFPNPAICPVYLVMQKDVRESPRIRAVANFLQTALKGMG